MEEIHIAKINIYFEGEREKIERKEAAFTGLKLIKGLKKAKLYGKALEWIAKDEKAKAKFMEHLSKKAQEQQLVISK